MPGILPMKVIKVGTSAQSRIAQACDRCRSKKIRCDGIRPCCSQCTNVGFECKTSDKLSRRAFPRGYTESLEERVRALENEVRDLKDILDEKEEKIDLLSKMHSNKRPSHSSTASSPSVQNKDEMLSKEGVFRVQASPLLVGSETSDAYFMGASSGRAFIDAFRRKVQESGKSCSTINTDAFLNVQADLQTLKSTAALKTGSIPPRLFSDRCINIFWQEWAPLFPVINKPTFLRLYEDFVANPEGMVDNQKLAQLHLVFSIAGLSSDLPDKAQIAICENQWRTSLDLIIMDNTLETLQCLILAMLYCISNGDYKRLQHYRSVAVGLSHRLGLHQSQKRFSFGALTSETRKKAFWTLYTADCFTAALLGLPRLIKESDVDVDFPLDLDDEYVTEKGYLPTLPGESSKISSALALFRVSRIMSKVLERNYPAAASYDLSLHSISVLESELNEWSDNLPQHHKLTFVQDKPSTDVTGSRSALLSLAYYYIRTLIHRPAVGSTLGNKASSSIISLAESSKHMIQIVQLLEERSMCFSFCLNKNEMLTLCGLSLLYQGLDLKQEGKLMKDGQRLIATVSKYLGKANAPGAADFKKLALSMILSDFQSTAHRRTSDQIMSRPELGRSPSISGMQPMQSTSRSSSLTSENELSHQREIIRRATLPSIAINGLGRPSKSSQSPLSVRSNSPMSRDEYHATTMQPLIKNPIPKDRVSKLEYLSLGNTPPSSKPHSPDVSRSYKPISQLPNVPIADKIIAATPGTSVTSLEWENILSSLDGGLTNIYDAVYGGPAISFPQPAGIASSAYNEWDLSPEAWDMAALSMSMSDFDSSAPPTAQSVLSYSEESLSSGDEFAGQGVPDYGSVMVGGNETFFYDGLDVKFGL